MAVGTLSALKARIALEISRPDLTGPIADAINDAITIYQKDRFRFSEISPKTPLTFQTVGGQSVYTSSDLPDIGTMYFIDYILVQLGSTLITLDQDTPLNLHRLLQIGTQQGLPSSFAYEGDSLIIYPVPNTAYTCYLGAHILIAAPASDNEAGNKWMTDGERLIRSRAKYEIAVHNTRNMAMAEAMSPEAPPGGKATGHATWRYWRELKGEGAKITGQGRMRPMRF
jgi:hypothetical protein